MPPPPPPVVLSCEKEPCGPTNKGPPLIHPNSRDVGKRYPHLSFTLKTENHPHRSRSPLDTTPTPTHAGSQEQEHPLQHAGASWSHALCLHSTTPRFIRAEVVALFPQGDLHSTTEERELTFTAYSSHRDCGMLLSISLA